MSADTIATPLRAPGAWSRVFEVKYFMGLIESIHEKDRCTQERGFRSRLAEAGALTGAQEIEGEAANLA
jgi:hypothetical protein